MSTLLQFPRYDVRYNTATNNIIKWGPFTVDGVDIDASATATIAISNPAGTEIVSATAMTAALPYFTYAVDTSDTDDYPLDERYIADILVTHSAKVYPYRVFFDVVRSPFVLMVGDDDIIAQFPSAGSRYPSGQTDYSKQLLLAFEEIKTEILAQGFRPALMVDPAQFRLPVIFLTLHILHRNIWKKESADRWSEDADYWFMRYEKSMATALATVMVRYDSDEDGKVGDDETTNTSPHRLLL